MGNSADHTIFLVFVKIAHEAEIEDAKFSVFCSEHVSGMRVSVEESRLQQLHKITSDTNVDKAIDLLVT